MWGERAMLSWKCLEGRNVGECLFFQASEALRLFVLRDRTFSQGHHSSFKPELHSPASGTQGSRNSWGENDTDISPSLRGMLFSSVQFSHSIVSDSLWPCGLQCARHPCPSPSPRAYSNSCQSSQWSHPTISSSVVPFLSCLQSFPASGSFLMSQFFTSGGQSTGSSASAFFPTNIQDWFPLGWTGLISLQSKGLSRAFFSTTVQNISSLVLSFLYGPTLISIHDYWKNHSFD